MARRCAISFARDLIDAALAADLSQNELRVFLALFRQTLCYGKTADPLTYKRLVQLTRVRKDRLIPALPSILNHGLLSIIPHAIFDYAYAISERFLSEYPQGFYVSALPKNRSPIANTEVLSEKARQTTKDSILIQPTHPKTADDLPYPSSFSPLNNAKLLPVCWAI